MYFWVHFWRVYIFYVTNIWIMNDKQLSKYKISTASDDCNTVACVSILCCHHDLIQEQICRVSRQQHVPLLISQTIIIIHYTFPEMPDSTTPHLLLLFMEVISRCIKSSYGIITNEDLLRSWDLQEKVLLITGGYNGDDLSSVEKLQDWQLRIKWLGTCRCVHLGNH